MISFEDRQWRYWGKRSRNNRETQKELLIMLKRYCQREEREWPAILVIVDEIVIYVNWSKKSYQDWRFVGGTSRQFKKALWAVFMTLLYMRNSQCLSSLPYILFTCLGFYWLCTLQKNPAWEKYVDFSWIPMEQSEPFCFGPKFAGCLKHSTGGPNFDPMSQRKMKNLSLK